LGPEDSGFMKQENKKRYPDCRSAAQPL